MAQEKPTPFPWKWDGDDLCHIGTDYEREDGVPADPHRYTGISANRKLRGSPVLAANKRLIAAAPDHALIASALCNGIARWERWFGYEGKGEVVVDRLRYTAQLDEFGVPELHSVLRAAIARATSARTQPKE